MATLNGAIGFQVENAMASIGAAWALNLSWAAICQGLSNFVSDTQGVPGRFNLFQYKGATIIADYGHNPDAIKALVQAVTNLPAQRRSVVISGGGVKTTGAQTYNDMMSLGAATTLQRLTALPNLPTMDEQGLKGFEVKVWHGMYAPKGTPKPVIDKLVAALQAAMADPAVKQRLADLSSDVPAADKLTPKGLQTHLEAEIKKWTPVIQKAGIYAD